MEIKRRTVELNPVRGAAPDVLPAVPHSPRPSKETTMRLSRLALATLLTLIGLVWIGQGIGAIGGSVMTGSPFWAVVGAVLLVLALVIVLRERRPTTRR